MRFILFVISALCLVGVTFGQNFNGQVFDAETGRPIPFVSIYIPEVQIGTIANDQGKFSFDNELPDAFSIRVSAEFYDVQIIEIDDVKVITIVNLEPSHLEFEDVIVSSPKGGLKRENVFNIERLDIKDLNAIQSSNLAEALSNMNGVQNASTGVGISKPVIRGQQGLRVLTLLNGVRLNNQQWGGDHGMGLSQLGIGSVELIKGPSSLLYGSDAFGGVVYLIDEPYPDVGKQRISVASRFESVNLGFSNFLNYGISKGNIRFNTGGYYANATDYKLPNGNFLNGSRFNEYAGKMSMSYSKKNWVSHVRYSYSNAIVGIPGHTHDSIIDPTSFQSTERDRDVILPYQRNILHVGSWENKFFFKGDEFRLLTAFTSNNLKEHEEKVTIPGLHVKLYTSIFDVRYSRRVSEKVKVVTGYQGTYQVNMNQPKAEERLIPDFNQLDNGLYAVAYWKAGKFDLQIGARLDHRYLEVGADSLEKNYYAPNFSLGFVRKVKKNTIRFNVSSGYRAPHVSELLSNGVHHGALRYEIGNRALNPEQSIQGDLTYEFEGEHLSLIVNPFMNYLWKYIVLSPRDSVIDGLPVVDYSAMDEALLYGVDFGFHYHPHFAHALHLESSYSYVRGHSTAGENMTLIPQSRVNTFIKLDLRNEKLSKKNFKLLELVLQHQYYFRQDFTGYGETSSIDYHLLNFGVNGEWGRDKVLNWSIGVKNLLNEEYINHLSRLKNINTAHPGRNVYLSLAYKIPSF